MKSFLVIIVMLVAFTGCVKKNKVPVASTEVANPAMHQVKVEEVVQASNYTYLRVSDNNAEIWMAVNAQEAAPGEVYYYDSANALEMKDFNSKELKRTFPSIYFVQNLSKEPIAAPAAGASMGEQKLPAKPVKNAALKKEGVSVAPAQDGLTIDKLYADRSNYEGKKVKMKGQVVKINEGVMGKNWIHIQDGTGTDNFDLTVTTLDGVKMDDVVAFEGTISLKKDFGYGYFYEVIMEDAKLVK
jgi:hypothetical protein